MSATTGQFRLPEFYSTITDPVGENPFAVEDRRHGIWENATRQAEDEILRSNAEPPSTELPATLAEFTKRYADRFVLPKFNAWANRGIKVVSSADDLRQYEEWLGRYVNSWLDAVEQDLQRRPPPFPAEPIILTVRMLLTHRMEFWRAEARSRLSAEAQLSRWRNRAPVSEGVRERRRAIVRQYCVEHGVPQRQLAENAGVVESALRGIIAEDRARFSMAAQARLLKILRKTPEEWYRE
jgi:hypothetical protein